MYRYFVSYWNHYRNQPGSRFVHLDKKVNDDGIVDEANESLAILEQIIADLIEAERGQVTVLSYNFIGRFEE